MPPAKLAWSGTGPPVKGGKSTCRRQSEGVALDRIGALGNVTGEVITIVIVGRLLRSRRVRGQGQGGSGAKLSHLLGQYRDVFGDLVEQGVVETDHLRLAVNDRAGHELQRLAQ